MPGELKRAFTGKDSEMLTAAATIVENAISLKPELIARRSNWADPFFPNLQMRIAGAFHGILGVDNAKELRNATQIVHSIQKNAFDHLSFLKVQIEEDFKSNKALRNEILTNLGYTQHFKGATNRVQSEMIELLFKFKANMTPELKMQITQAGSAPDLIESIIGMADRLATSNISQEALKGSRKTITRNGIIELNAIYFQVISISRIASRFYKDNSAYRDMFSFKKIILALRGNNSGSAGHDNSINPV